MKLPAESPATIAFACNVCGHTNAIEAALFHRELAACTRCGSTPRMRGIVHALSLHLYGQSLPLGAFAPRPEAKGIGVSDWVGYAEPLAAICDYTNTFYHTEPFLDVTAPAADKLGRYDFVICSDVLEHVAPPVQRGFDGLHALLKPGGMLLLSVPYFEGAGTIEHFPESHDTQLVDFHGSRILVNRTTDGRFQVFPDLVFHGGDGHTLEMRFFAENDVFDHLRAAGFHRWQVLDQPMLDIGLYWPPVQWPHIAPLDLSYLIMAFRDEATS